MDETSAIYKDSAYHRRSVLEKMRAFSEDAPTLHLPYAHRALAIYLDADRFSQKKKIELLGELREDLEKLITKASSAEASWTAKVIAAEDLGCFKADLEALSSAHTPIFREFLYWSVIEHFSFVENMMKGVVEKVPFERDKNNYFRLVARYAALATGNRFVIYEEDGGIVADEQLF